jgi:DNA-binding SARP family transcriptional activator
MMSIVATVQQLIEECYACERAGEISQAYQRAEAAVAKAHAAQHAESISGALTSLAFAHYRLGHFANARSLAEEAYTCYSAPCESTVTILRLLGDCAHEQGDLQAAENFYHQAIDLGRQLGLTHLLHRCLHSLSACVYLPRGQFELALAADEESIRMAKKNGMVEDLWLPLLTFGWTLWIMGQRVQALQVAAEMEKFVNPGSLGQGYFYALRGDMAQEGEEPQTAVDWYIQARQVAEIVGDPGLSAEVRIGLSRACRSNGNVPAAYDWAEDALKVATRAESHDLQGSALIERGRASWELGDLPAAMKDFQEAIKIFTPMEANYDLARASLHLAGLLYQLNASEAGLAWREAATRIMRGSYDFLLERERAQALPLLATSLNHPNPEIADIATLLAKRLAQVAPPALRIFTLGRFSVQQERTVIQDNAWQRRAGELFRLLLVSPGRMLGRDQVIEALWPNSLPVLALDLFHRATSTLRRILEPYLPEKFPSRYLDVNQGAVSLRLPPGSWIDFEAFQAFITSKNWSSALELYRGELFSGDLYSDWSVGMREKLRQHAIQAALELARECLAAKEFKAAFLASQRAIELEPWQEEAVLIGMKACARQNDRITAIRMYQQLERRLRDELGIEPEAQVQAYYRSLL